MKKLFLVESNQIVRKAFETHLKDTHWDLYTLESMDDFEFRFTDYGADLLIVDLKLAEDDLSAQIPIVYAGFEDEIEQSKLVSQTALTLKKPIKMSDLTSILDSYLEC